MNRPDHDKRVAELTEWVSDLLHQEPTETADLLALIRDKLDDALADAYGSGEKDERRAVIDFLNQEPWSASLPSGVKSGGQVARVYVGGIQAGAHRPPDLAPVAKLAALIPGVRDELAAKGIDLPRTF